MAALTPKVVTDNLQHIENPKAEKPEGLMRDDALRKAVSALLHSMKQHLLSGKNPEVRVLQILQKFMTSPDIRKGLRALGKRAHQRPDLCCINVCVRGGGGGDGARTCHSFSTRQRHACMYKQTLLRSRALKGHDADSEKLRVRRFISKRVADLIALFKINKTGSASDHRRRWHEQTMTMLAPVGSDCDVTQNALAHA